MANWVLKGLRTGIKTTTLSPTRRKCAGRLARAVRVARLLRLAPEAASLARALPDRGDRPARRRRRGRARPLRPLLALPPRRRTVRPSPWEHELRMGRLYRRGRSGAAQIGQESSAARCTSASSTPGACGACISEARQLNNPYYNMHRLGFFMTPTPRNADVLLVAGPVSDAMRLPLRKTYDAMPEPKRVVAIGACAISGGVFGAELRRLGRRRRDHPGRRRRSRLPAAAVGDPSRRCLLVVERKPPAQTAFVAPPGRDARRYERDRCRSSPRFSCSARAGVVAALLAPERWNPVVLAAIGSSAALDRPGGERPPARRRTRVSTPNCGRCCRWER